MNPERLRELLFYEPDTGAFTAAAEQHFGEFARP
jgi:hypothetical protein